MNDVTQTRTMLIPGRPVILNIRVHSPMNRATIFRRALREVLETGYYAEWDVKEGNLCLVVTGVFTESAPRSLLLWDTLVDLGIYCMPLYYPGEDATGFLFGQGPADEPYMEFDITGFTLPVLHRCTPLGTMH